MKLSKYSVYVTAILVLCVWVLTFLAMDGMAFTQEISAKAELTFTPNSSTYIKINFSVLPRPAPKMSDFRIDGKSLNTLPTETNVNGNIVRINIFDLIAAPKTFRYKDYAEIKLVNQKDVLLFKETTADLNRISPIPLAAVTAVDVIDDVNENRAVVIDIAFSRPLNDSIFTSHPNTKRTKFLDYWTINDEESLPTSATFKKLNVTTYRITLSDTRIIPKTLKYRDFPEITLVEDTPVPFFPGEPLMPITVKYETSKVSFSRYNVKIRIRYNKPVEPEPALTDFSIDGGKPLPLHTALDCEDRTKTVLFLSMPNLTSDRIPKTLKIQGYEEVTLSKSEELAVKPANSTNINGQYKTDD